MHDRIATINKIAAQEIQKAYRLRYRLVLRLRLPGESRECSGHQGEIPAQIEPRRGGLVVMQFDPVSDEGDDRTDQHEGPKTAQQIAGGPGMTKAESREDGEQEEYAKQIAEVDIAHQSFRRQHLSQGEIKEGRENQAHDYYDLQQVEKYLSLGPCPPADVREEEDHQNGRGVEAPQDS
jgi:hypothetical protein